METKYNKAKFSDVVKYSLGGFGGNLGFFLTMSYLTFFYTDIFGISSMVVATLMLMSRFIDAFTDPLMGMIGDHTRTKLGKFRPYIIFGAPILGIVIFLLFTAPNMSANMKIVYAYVIYIAYSLASTVVNIPFQSLTPVMSEDPYQRTVIVSWKMGMGVLSQFVITVLALPLVELFGGGKQGWAIYGALIGILTTISFWICAWGGKPYDVCDMTEKKKKENPLKDLVCLAKNKSMLMLMIAFGTDVLANATYSAVNVYYFKYVLHREDLVAAASMAILVGGLVLLPFLPALSKKIGKKKLYWIGSLFSIVPLVVTWFNPTPGVTVLMTAMAAYGVFARIPGNLGWAMLPECSDFAEWKFNKRVDGLMTSSLTFINKFGMALGGFIASFFLGLVGFVANQEQPQAVINMIVFLRFGMPVLGYVASLISMAFYELTETKYAQIRADLDARHNQKTKES